MKNFTMLAILITLALPLASVGAATIGDAVASEARSEADRAVDSRRKPAEFLSWIGIKEGMAVLDVFGGGGYYAEIISRAVGENGFVTLYNNESWDTWAGKNVQARLEGDRLPNVDYLVEAPFNLELDGEYDAGIFVLGMHDIYFADPENGWPAIDVPRFLKSIHKALKQGAVLGVIDHNAVAGTDPAVVSRTLHRIDPAIIRRDLTAAGFTYEGSIDLLRNPADDLSKQVFDPEIRRQTDRSVMKFRKE